MKKLIFMFVTAALLCGCVEKTDNALGVNKTNTVITSDGITREGCMVVMDSCEYFVYSHGLSHRARCKFCEERRKAEIEEAVQKVLSGNSGGKEDTGFAW